MSVQNISNDETVNNLVKEALDASSARSRAISNNMANINTKGYKREYVTFEENLKNSIDNLQLKTDDNRHMQLDDNSSGDGSIVTKVDNSTSMREDGNNVDMDVETVNQAANELMYNSLITLENNKLSMLRNVINGN